MIDRTIPGLAARATAHDAVAALLGEGRQGALDDALGQAAGRHGLAPGDAGLARAIATAAFRRLGGLRAIVGGCMPQGWPEGEPRLAALLATGAVQVLDLAVADHAAVDLSVRLAKAEPGLQHRAGLVNALLRRLQRERAAIEADPPDALDANTPAWLAARWRAQYGTEAARRIAEAHMAGAALDLTPRAEAETWAERLGGSLLELGSIRLTGIETAVPDLPGYAEGAWWVQDAAAALPARLLAVQPGETVADLCAAPGGKTAQLAAAGARVAAVDRSAPRLERLRRNLARLGLEAEVVTADALTLPDAPAYDAILVDAPCSATGTIRRHPDVAWTKSEADVIRLAVLQARLLAKAATLLRPGGRLVYCTCSLEPEEGERQIAAFLERNRDFTRVPVAPEEVGGLGALIDAQGDLRTRPDLIAGGIDGFFASRLVRSQGARSDIGS